MKNNRALLIIIVTIVALFIGAVVFLPQLNKEKGSSDSGSGDTTTTTQVDVSKYDTSKVIAANSDNGGIADHVKGNLETAKVVIFEYADYACSGCATVNPWIKEIAKEYKDDLAIVFRVFPLVKGHPNAIAAASAVEAAGLQGYWEEYGNLVFENQAEWFYLTGDKRTNMFASYFETVSKGKGDVEKFKADMAGDAVKAKVSFDRSISESLNLSATPSFFDENGKEIDWSTNVEPDKNGIQNFFRNYINKKLNK
jgi:protein-disulfide isomerase